MIGFRRAKLYHETLALGGSESFGGKVSAMLGARTVPVRNERKARKWCCREVRHGDDKIFAPAARCGRDVRAPSFRLRGVGPSPSIRRTDRRLPTGAGA